MLRSEDNHMDPCFRFPVDDLQWLFDQATVVEAMLIALEHMQVNFVTVSATGLRKFRRNTLSFPQDVVSFAQRLDLMKQYRPGDRVNSVRGPGQDPRNPDREVKKAVQATDEERRQFAVDWAGDLIIPGRVRQRLPDGLLVVDYDSGGEGLERVENLTPRVTMPWHPKQVPLHIMLRRNVGRGKDVLEGLEVRWAFVANLVQALCAFPRDGYGEWRLGGSKEEPMHKYYDPRLFHMMDADELKLNFAPKEVGGVVLKPDEVEKLDIKDRIASAVDLSTPQQYIAAGFDVNFVGPQDVAAGVAVDGPPGDGVGDAPADGESSVLYVDEGTFSLWLDSTEFTVGLQVQKWWAGLTACEEDAADALKMGDDETTVELSNCVQFGEAF